MKIKSLILALFLLTTSFMAIFVIVHRVSAQPLLLDDVPVVDSAPVPDDYEFDILSVDHAVVGVRPKTGDDFDIEVYTDTTFVTLIESSTSVGDTVDFVVLDKMAWASPPNRGARVTSGITNYTIEMENNIDDHPATDAWSGTMVSYPVLNPGPFGSWDDQYVYYPTVLYDGTTYHMWYAGKDGTYIRIGYATSPDGIKWTKSGSNPVLDVGPSAWEGAAVWAPTVLYDSMTSTYKMWYSGSDATFYKIGYATSPDGITWTKNAANPVLNLGSPGSWDDYRVYEPMVLYDGVTYHMWYSGSNGPNLMIGYATSPDGITWTKNAANPVLNLGPPGSWDDTYLFAPTVIYNVATYHLWYAGFDGLDYRIGYATSPDGITWAKNPSNPVLDLGPSGSWDELWIWAPMVLYDGTTYHMWYSGTNSTYQGIGYATSLDGINWIKTPSEVLDAYEINGIMAGSSYIIDLDVPGTLNLDLFIFNTTGGRINAVATSTNEDIGANESISFTAPATGDYLLVITNEDGGTGAYIIFPIDNPPVITVYEPGGTPFQIYTQGDIITVTWTADDDKLLPLNPINITYGVPLSGWTTVSMNEANDGTYFWDTSIVPCPGTFWMNLSVYDSIGQEAYDWSNFSFDIVCDNPPTIEAWEPGGTPIQTHTQGDLITVTWTADDDYPLPPNPMNISYGIPLSGWTIVSVNEANDGMYLWDTSAVPCPAAYWMNLSVYDSIGQEVYDWSNFSFEIVCDNPPIIEAWEPGGTPLQMYTQGDIITVTWTAGDDNPLPPNPINITYGVPLSGWTTISMNEPNDGIYNWGTSAVPCPGIYWMKFSAYDSLGQTTFDIGNYSFTINCPIDNPPAITAYEPGGTVDQIYTQGDLITITWIANDDNTLPLNPINITYGDLNGWTTIATDEVNDGTYLWDTSTVPCPDTHWMNLTVYDSIGQEAYDWSNFSFNIVCDNPPSIEAWEPGSTPFQTYTQGDIITVTWIADDNKPLPPNPINITYGVPPSGWTTLSTSEVNDGLYLWDTSSVVCPCTYWMNLSVYDSIGQETYDWSNFSFDILCDNPPIIEVWEAGGTPFQIYTQGDIITVTWTADDNKPLSTNPINITYGVPLSSWAALSASEANDGLYLWDTSTVSCPGTYWMNLSVYDSIGQETYDWSNFSFDVICDNPPTIEAWEPGGSPLQTYTQGDIITVTWTADDNKPLPTNPINITYGVPLIGWATLSISEANDGTYLWITSSVVCPGTYWMNLSVHDSIGQVTYDWSNFSFDIECPPTYPPVIKNVEAEPEPQIVGHEVTISAEVTDEDTNIEDLTVNITIMKPDGSLFGNYSMICDSTGKCSYSSNFDIEGIYTFTIWANDTDDNWDYASGIFVMEPKPQEYNWKPIIALIFSLILLHIGILVSLRRPIRFTGILGRDRVYTYLSGVLPFVIAEALISIISFFTGLLSVPPILGIGMIVDLIILIVGIISCGVIITKGSIPKSYEEKAQTSPPPPQSQT